MDEKTKLARRNGIGGSDVAAILGFSPWRSAMDVWLDKKGLRDEEPDEKRDFLLDLGTELEPVIAKLYERQTKKKLHHAVVSVHNDHKILFAHPDRLIAGERRGVELKSENQFSDQFGDPGSEDVPIHYFLQCAHYMNVMNFDSWDLALLHGGTRFAVYTLNRDKTLEAEITHHLLDWWDRYIVKDVPPDVDSSDAWRKYLAKKFPAQLLPMKAEDRETTAYVHQLLAARAGLERFERIFDEMTNRLKLAIGEHEGIEGEFGKITWRKAKDSQLTDWEDVALSICRKFQVPQSEFAQLVSNYSITRPGPRRFLITPKKGWTNGSNSAEIKTGVGQIAAGNIPGNAGALQEGDRASAPEASER